VLDAAGDEGDGRCCEDGGQQADNGGGLDNGARVGAQQGVDPEPFRSDVEHD